MITNMKIKAQILLATKKKKEMKKIKLSYKSIREVFGFCCSEACRIIF